MTGRVKKSDNVQAMTQSGFGVSLAQPGVIREPEDWSRVGLHAALCRNASVGLGVALVFDTDISLAPKPDSGL